MHAVGTVADLLTRQPLHTLDDEELDSGNDDDRYGRAAAHIEDEDGEDAAYSETLNVMDLSLSRAPEPQSSNGEVWACSFELRMPTQQCAAS
jgi:RNA polymerase-associated protein LEO1